MQERIQHVLQGWLGGGGPGGKALQGGLQRLGHTAISQEAHALDLREEADREDRPFQSLLHTGPLPSTPCTPDPSLAAVAGAPTLQRGHGGGSSLSDYTHPLPTHLQEETTQSLECAVREGGEVSQSCALQNKTHLFMREDAAALEPHELAKNPKHAATQHFRSQSLPAPLLCSALC